MPRPIGLRIEKTPNAEVIPERSLVDRTTSGMGGKMQKRHTEAAW